MSTDTDQHITRAETNAQALFEARDFDAFNVYTYAAELDEKLHARPDGIRSLENYSQLRALRAIGWSAQSKTPGIDGWHALRPTLDEWLGLLISTRLARSFTFLGAGERFEGPLGDLRDSEEPAISRLQFLKQHWRRLSSQERELALAIFLWDKDSPTLVWWIEDASDLVLDEIEDFLSRRYCFPLLHALRQIRRGRAKETDSETPTQSGALARWLDDFAKSPRLGAFAGIGFLGLASVDAAHALAFASHWVVAVVGAGLAFAAVLGITFLDIESKNRGAGLPRAKLALKTWTRIRSSGCLRRSCRTCSFYALWVLLILLITGLAVGIMQAAGIDEDALWREDALDELVLPAIPGASAPLHSMPRFIVGMAAFGSWVMLTGALLQWFWDLKAGIERM